MTDESFTLAFQRVISAEGGYVNDPRDPGGETKFGIAKRSHPSLDIANLTIDGAKQIYRGEYWEVIDGDKLPWPLALYVFDAAVNQGVSTAAKLLQRVLSIPQDGIMGVTTLGAVAKANAGELGARYLAERALAYTGTRGFDTFGRGWLKRLFLLAEGA